MASPKAYGRHVPARGAIDPALRIGHAHFKVSRSRASLEFYNGILGSEITQKLESRVFYQPTDTITELNTCESLCGSPPPAANGWTVPLGHSLFDSRCSDRHLAQSAVGADSAGRCDGPWVNESIYPFDPDDTGVELYCDEPKARWPRDQ